MPNILLRARQHFKSSVVGVAFGFATIIIFMRPQRFFEGFSGAKALQKTILKVSPCSHRIDPARTLPPPNRSVNRLPSRPCLRGRARWMRSIVNCASRYRMRCVANVAWRPCKPGGLSFWPVPRPGLPNCVFIKTQSLPTPELPQAFPSRNSPSKWHPCLPFPRSRQDVSLFPKPAPNIYGRWLGPWSTLNCRPCICA
jgi:hypothetical protein